MFRSLTTKRPYKPPIDVKEKIQKVVLDVVQGHVDNWLSVSLKEPLIKYKVWLFLCHLSLYDHSYVICQCKVVNPNVVDSTNRV
jgi:hypothetical protein